MTYSLEKYRGRSSRHTCPGCGKRYEFARYIDENGDYLRDDCGRCNRESSCGYHLTPKELGDTEYRPQRKKAMPQPEHFDIIDNSFIIRSLEQTKANRFINYLLGFIDIKHVEEAIRKYFIGGTKDGKTVFWQIDRDGKARTGKIISYDGETGKRIKSVPPNWVHAELKKHKLLPESFRSQLCFFGEHLLNKMNKPLAIVEAEKTAVIASIFLPDFLWLAIGGKSYLKAEKLNRFKGRKIILYPDADAFELWSTEAGEANKNRLSVEVSEMIERVATAAEKEQGFDLADYLIRDELSKQKHDAKVQFILSDHDSLEYFNELVEERKAIMETDSLTDKQLREVVEFMNI